PVNAWTHGAWMLLSIPATLVLWRQSRGDHPKQWSLLAYGLGLFCCFAGSTFYHGVRLPPRYVDMFETLDHVGIFLLIAGTYTPAAFTLLRGWWKWGSLTAAWLLAAVGIGLRLCASDLNPFLSTGL